MNLFSRLPWNKKKQSKNIQQETQIIPKKKRKILVISWWWFRWTYALWILKAIEENHIDKEIDAVYWVSIWAIIWSVRLTWMKAEDIFHILTQISIKDVCWKDLFTRSKSFVSNKKIRSMIQEYLPKDFKSLKKPFYAWVIDTNTGKFNLFHSGDLQKIVLWSMSIPWIFPPVEYDKYSLIDGWPLNNFPADLAKKDYPDHEIIWIALNKFQANRQITSAFENLITTLQVIIHSKVQHNIKKVDYLFYRELPIAALSLNKEQMHEAFALWYEDWCKMFWNINS